MGEFTSVAELAKTKRISAYLLSETGRFLTANKTGIESLVQLDDAIWHLGYTEPCIWDISFMDDAHVTLRCASLDKYLTAVKFMATKFFSGFVGEVSATAAADKVSASERWNIVYAGRPGRFHVRSNHGLLLSVTDKGRVRAEMDLTPETNLLEVTIRMPSAVVPGPPGSPQISHVGEEASDNETGEELTRVWNDLDYADEHHSVSETQAMEKAKKAAMASKPKLSDSGSKLEKLKGSKSAKVEYKYFTAPYPTPMTLAYVTQVLGSLREGVLLEVAATKRVMEETRKLLNILTNVNRIDVPTGVRLTVVGDLHGQFGDLLEILKLHGEPSAQNWYLFNGDFVDRGPQGIEVLLVIYLYKILYPSCVFFNRGNHEARAMNNKYQFEDECLEKYNKEIYTAAEDSFDMLPLCAVIDNRVFVVHGGLFSTHPTMKEISNINRKREIPIGQADGQSTLMIEMLWSDPKPDSGTGPSKRGAGVLFGPDVTNAFLASNHFEYMIRSHEVAALGYEENHGGKCITLFSASHYCGKQENKGAVALFASKALRPTYTQYYVGPTLATSQKPKHSAALKADAIQQLKEQIFAKRSALKKHWDGKRPQASKHHIISVAAWSEGLNHVLGVNMKWHKYLKEFAKLDAEGNINYKDFLDSFRISLSEQTYRQYEEMLVETCAKVYNSLADFTVAFRKADLSGSGLLSVKECTTILQSLEIGLNASGITALLETLHFNSQVSLADFNARFKLVYEQKVLPHEPWIPEAIAAIGDAIMQRRISFQEISKTGVLNYDDFSKLLKELNPSLSHDQRKTLAKYVDSNQNGSIDLREFSAAFKVTHVRPDAWRAVVDRLMELFYQHRQHLKSLFRLLDTDNSGALDYPEFRAGLHGLNVLIDDPLTEEEIKAVFRLFDRNNNEVIDYDEFVTFLRDLHVEAV